jgi:CheY-like chemotaxis protein
VEDDPFITWMVSDELAERGYQVATANNGVEALQRVEQARPDVIVLDLMLPVMHGWEFVERYRQKTGGASLPIIVVSAAGGVPRSMETCGVQRYLRKPFDIQELARCVSEATATRQPAPAAVSA